MSEYDDLISHFRDGGRNQEGAWQPVIPTSRLPRAEVPEHRPDNQADKFFNDLMSGVPGSTWQSTPQRAKRGFDSEYPRDLNRAIDQKRERNIARELDEGHSNVPPASDDMKMIHLRPGMTDEEMKPVADALVRHFDSVPSEEDEREHGLQHKLRHPGSVYTTHHGEDVEGFLRDRWQLRAFPWQRPAEKGELRPSNKWVKKVWKQKVGPLACEHEKCPPWECRQQQHEAAVQPEQPWYYGTTSEHAPGDQIEHHYWKKYPDRPDFRENSPLYTTTDSSLAAHIADLRERESRGESRGRLYQVTPTGPLRPDEIANPLVKGEASWQTSHPLRVVREVPREEWPEDLNAWRREAAAQDQGEELTGHFEAAAQHPEGRDWFYGEQPAHTADLPDEMHRGIPARLPPEVHAIVHDESRPAGERARTLMEYLGRPGYGSGGIGTHWSVKPSTARGFATQYDTWNHSPYDFAHDPESTQVIFHARTAEPGQMIRGERHMRENDIFGVNHSEGEIPLKKRSRVALTGISWSRNEEDAPLTRHDFPVPLNRSAGAYTAPAPEEEGYYGEHGHEPHEAAARPGRGEKTCPCCKGEGSHGDGSECAACGSSGSVGRSDQPENCPGQPQPRRRHWREGAAAPSLEFRDEFRGTHGGHVSWSGSRVPQDQYGTLHAHDPQGGEHLGKLDYRISEPNDPDRRVLVEDLKTSEGHGGKGVASALMDHLYAQHPEPARIEHGYRTDEGGGWWDKYISSRPEISGREERQRAADEAHEVPPDDGRPWYHASGDLLEEGDEVQPQPGEDSVRLSDDPYRASAHGPHVHEVRFDRDPHGDVASASVVRRLGDEEIDSGNPYGGYRKEGAMDQPAEVPAAERTESVRHILDHYEPYDADTWDEVRGFTDWDHPKVRAFVDDIGRRGVLRPIPIDYEQDPPRVRNGHTRLLSAERAGVETVPTRQHEGWVDPDDDMSDEYQGGTFHIPPEGHTAGLGGQELVAHFEVPPAAADVTLEHREMPSGGSSYPHMHVITATHPDGTQAELRYMLSKRNGKGVVDHAYIPGDYAQSLGVPLVQEARRLHPGTFVKGLPGLDEDWGRHLPSVSSLHRHLTMRLEPADRDFVHDESVPAGRRAAHLMDLMKRGGASMHWASQRGRAAAEQAFGDHEFRSPEHTQVALSARPPAQEHVEDDPERISRNGGYAYQAPDWEVPIKEGAPVTVSSVRWRTGNAGWTRHQFRDGHQLTAGRVPAADGSAVPDADLLGHFEAAEGDYRITHTAPNPVAGHLPLHHYTGDDPGSQVQIYRSAPAGTESINPGDWISLNPAYAHTHGFGMAKDGGHWPVYTARVPQEHVHWDENDEDEHGYSGPPIHHPDVHDEETGAHHDWEAWHGEHPHGQEAWAGGAVHLPQEQHDLVHDDCEWEPDRADAVLGAARRQGTLHGSRWHDDLYPARDDAEARAATLTPPEGHRLTTFTVHRGDSGRVDDVAVHPFEHGDEKIRRYQNMDLSDHDYEHPAADEVGRQPRQAAALPVTQASAPEEYGISHRPSDDLDQFHDLGDHTFPEDVYDHPEYFGGGGGHGNENIRQMRAARGKPDHPVTIYRAMHRDAPREVNPGDWVAVSRRYADFHAETQGYPANDWHVVSATVPARHIRSGAGSDLHEWGYWGPRVTAEGPPSPGQGRREAAVEADQPVTFRTSNGKRKGIAHVTITAWDGDQKAGHARVTDSGRTLDDLYVDPARRGSGVGHALMGEVISRFGDKAISLEAAPFTRGRGDKGGLGQNELREFYAGHGFEADGDSGRMVRRPAAASEHLAVTAGDAREPDPHEVARLVDHFRDEEASRHQDDLKYVPEWGPLHQALPEAEHPGWMFMQRHQPPEGERVTYKHGITRANLTLDHQGRAFGRDATDDSLWHGPFEPSAVLEHRGHYRDLRDMGESRESVYDEDYRARRNQALGDAGWNVVEGSSPAEPRLEVTAAEEPQPRPRAKRWYHGTRHELSPGDELEGGIHASNQGYGQPGDHVYYSGKPSVAGFFAQCASGPEEDDWEGTPRVYQVEPDETHEPDPDEEEHADSWRARKARVLREVPWQPHWGRQGSSQAQEVTASEEAPVPENDRRFFHGTSGTHSFQPGDLLTPDGGRMSHVYYTSHLPSAARYATYGHPLNERGYQDLNADAVPGHVYEVIPETKNGKRIGRHAEDPYSGLPGNEEAYRTKSRLRVLHEVDRETGEPMGSAGHTAALAGHGYTRITPQRDLDGYLWPRHRNEATGAEERVPGEAPLCVNCTDSHTQRVHHFPEEGHRPREHSAEFVRLLDEMTREKCPECGSRNRHSQHGDVAVCANCSHAFDVSPGAIAARRAHEDENNERDRRGLPAQGPYYHGTTEEDLEEVTPGRGHAFGMDHDGTHAYATATPGHAWSYAEKASLGNGRPPRVYEVTPKADDLEKDPTRLADGWLRGNNDDDVRSRSGFDVQREMPVPEEHRDLHGDDDDWGHEAALEATAMDDYDDDDWEGRPVEPCDEEGIHEPHDDCPGVTPEEHAEERRQESREREEAQAHQRHRDSLPYVPPPPEGELRDHMHHMHGMDSHTADLYMSVANQRRWHHGEHGRTNMTHQHDEPRGTPGERQWPDAFQLSEHTDFAGGTPGYNGRWDRAVGNGTEKLRPIMPSESSLHQAAADPRRQNADVAQSMLDFDRGLSAEDRQYVQDAIDHVRRGAPASEPINAGDAETMARSMRAEDHLEGSGWNVTRTGHYPRGVNLQLDEHHRATLSPNTPRGWHVRTFPADYGSQAEHVHHDLDVNDSDLSGELHRYYGSEQVRGALAGQRAEDEANQHQAALEVVSHFEDDEEDPPTIIERGLALHLERAHGFSSDAIRKASLPRPGELRGKRVYHLSGAHRAEHDAGGADHADAEVPEIMELAEDHDGESKDAASYSPHDGPMDPVFGAVSESSLRQPAIVAHFSDDRAHRAVAIDPTSADHVLPPVTRFRDGTFSGLAAWGPQEPGDVDEMLRDIPLLFEACRDGILQVAATFEDDAPVHPMFPELLRQMAAKCAMAAEEARGLALRPDDPPEGTWSGPRELEPPKG